MVTSARFKFIATVVVSVLAVLLTLFVPGEDEAANRAVTSASELPAPQR